MAKNPSIPYGLVVSEGTPVPNSLREMWGEPTYVSIQTNRGPSANPWRDLNPVEVCAPSETTSEERLQAACFPDPISKDEFIERETERVKQLPVEEVPEKPEDTPVLEPSLLGIAKLFAYENAKTTAWVPEWKSWVVYNGVRWEKREPELFFSRVLSIVQKYLDGTIDDRAFGSTCLVPKRLRDILELARELLELPATSFDAVPHLLNLPNGTLDLRLDGEGLREHRAEDHLTAFCPTELVVGKISPLWRKALHHALPDREIRHYFQRCMGYALLGRADEDFLLFQLGETRSGKGTTQQAITATLGDDYVLTCASGDFAKAGGGREASEHLHGLRGKRLAVVPEHNRRTHFNSDLLKSLTGGDKQRTRGLYQKPETWTPQCTLVIASNPGLRLEFEDEALWRRVRVIPFTETLSPDKVDPEVRETLRRNPEEHQAVLSWLYHGCLEYQRDGLQPPPSVGLATSELREEVDPLADWFDEEWEVDPDATEIVPNSTIFASYQNWCDTSRVPSRLRRLQRSLSVYLKAKGMENVKTKGIRGFRRIKSKNNVEKPNPWKKQA